jgi:hypothetical protein
METDDANKDKVFTVLLRHPSMQDAAVLAPLMASAQQLASDVAAQCAGQGRLLVTVKSLPAAQQLSSWLQCHAHLLQDLEVVIDGGKEAWQAEAFDLFGEALQQQHAQLQLRSFVVRHAVPMCTATLLQLLPAGIVTKLSIGVHHGCYDDDSDPDSSCTTPQQLAAVAAMTSLQSLDLAATPKKPPFPSVNGLSSNFGMGMPTGQAIKFGNLMPALDSYWEHPYKDADTVLGPLAALQHLTELKLGVVNPRQLWHLPSSLQHLHVAVQIDSSTEPLQLLSGWVEQHGTKLVSLSLGGGASYHPDQSFAEFQAFQAAVEALGKAFAAAAATSNTVRTAAAARAGAEAEAAAMMRTAKPLQVSSMCLQALGVSCAPLLQHLPANTPLKHLEGCLDFSKQTHVAAVAHMTALQSLALLDAWQQEMVPGHAPSPRWDVALKEQCEDVLAPLLALQQLQHLHLQSATPAQLRWLPAQLKQLCVATSSFGLELNYAKGHSNDLQLGHLTALTAFQVSRTADDLVAAPLPPQAVLPPNLEDFVWDAWTPSSCLSCWHGDHSHQEIPNSTLPLLHLSKLQRLTLKGDVAPSAEDLQQLTNLAGLQELHLMTHCAPALSHSVAVVLRRLPLKSLVWRERKGSRGNKEAAGKRGGRAQCHPKLPMQALGALTQLTRLELFGPPVFSSAYDLPDVDTTLVDLAAQLSPLTALHQLALMDYIMKGCETRCIKGGVHGERRSREWNSYEGVMQLASAIAGLPCLRSLNVKLGVVLPTADKKRVLEGCRGALAEHVPALELQQCEIVAGGRVKPEDRPVYCDRLPEPGWLSLATDRNYM